MKKLLPTYPRILAITPSTRGFGFALIEGLNTLVDWGVKRIQEDKNTQSIMKIKELVAHYQPNVMVLEDTSIKPFHRAARIRCLTRRITRFGEKSNIKVALFSPQQVRQCFFGDDQGSKHALAEILAQKFADELGFRLPPKRRAGMSEDARKDVFDAVALALVARKTD